MKKKMIMIRMKRIMMITMVMMMVKLMMMINMTPG